MPANAAATNTLGTMGTICWTIQLVPQIWKSWRAKSTEGLSEHLVFFWGAAGAFMGVYAIVEDLNIPLIVQPQLFSALCFTSWCQCQYYGHKRSKVKCIALFAACIAILAGFQAGMVYAVRPSYQRGDAAPVEVFGILSTVILALALLPQYYEIYKHKEVVGISVLFMTIDMLGGVFNDLSLAFKAQFNIIPSISYSLVAAMDGLVILLALILNPLARRRRKRAAATVVAEDLGPAETQEADSNDVELTNRPPRDTAGPEVPASSRDRKDRNHTQIDEVVRIEDV